MKHIILASKSPRRREILTTMGVRFEVVVEETDEYSDAPDVGTYVEELAAAKGRAVCEKLVREGRDLSDTVILSSDTVVEVDGTILGKPRDEADACRMITRLQGRTHRVVSGLCLIGEGKEVTAHEVTHVTFDPMDDATVLSHVRATTPYDKAGAYAIQGPTAAYIKGIEGDYFNVVGLPFHRLCTLYREAFGENLV